MAKMYGASEVAGPGKGKNRPNTKAKVAARQTARKASGMSAQKSYVKTRMAEAAKSGKTLDKAALRKKFQSGDVARKGFGAPKKSTGPKLTSEQQTKRSLYRTASDKNEADLKTLMSNTPMGTYSKGKAFADAEKSSEGKRRVAMYGRTRQGSK